MKNPLILIVVFAACLSMEWLAAAPPPVTVTTTIEEAPLTNEQVLELLLDTDLPLVEFDNVPVSQALKALETLTEIEGKPWLKTRLEDADLYDPPVTIILRNIDINQALLFLAEMVHCDARIENGIVVFTNRLSPMKTFDSVDSKSIPIAPISKITAISPATLELMDKLRQTEVPLVEFDAVPLSAVLKTLGQMTTGEGEPWLRAILLHGEAYDPNITITLRDLSLDKVLSAICQSVSYGWRVNAGVVIVGDFSSNPTAKTLALDPPLSNAELLVKLQETAPLDDFRFVDVPLSQVLDRLESSGFAHPYQWLTVKLVDAGGCDPVITITLRDLSFEQAFDAVCAAVNYRWKVEDGAVVIEPMAADSSSPTSSE